jgi:hypothetical protein
MSNPIQAAAAPSVRPRVVTIARTLTFMIAVLLAAAGVAFLALLLTTSATVTGDNPQNLTPAQLDQGIHVVGVIGAVFFFVIVAAQVTAGLLMSRASNAGRVTAWVVDGLTVLCCGCGLGTSVLGNGNVTTTTNNTSETLHFTTSDSAGPLGVVIFAATTVGLLLAIAVVVLLLLPDANEYFRRPPAVWNPTPWAGGIPGAPYGTPYQPQGPYPPAGPYLPQGPYGPPPGGESAPGWQRPPLPPPPSAPGEPPSGGTPPPTAPQPWGPPPGGPAHPGPPTPPPGTPVDPTAPPPDQQR